MSYHFGGNDAGRGLAAPPLLNRNRLDGDRGAVPSSRGAKRRGDPGQPLAAAVQVSSTAGRRSRWRTNTYWPWYEETCYRWGLMVMKIAIIGAGIGGLATALVLAQGGFSVEVYERASELVDQGAGITLAPNAARNLFHFGLEAALLETAVNQEHTNYRHHRTGVTLRRVSHVNNRERYGAPHLRTHRSSSPWNRMLKASLSGSMKAAA